MYKYIEIVEISSDTVASRMDVSAKSTRQIDKLEHSILFRINTDLFFVRTKNSDEALSCFDNRQNS